MNAIVRIEAIFRGVAQGLYPKTKYISGTPDLVAQVELKKDEVLCALYQGYGLIEQQQGFQTTNLGWFIGVQDTYTGSNTERVLNAIGSAEVIMHQFNEGLKAQEEPEAIQIGNLELSPQFKQNQDLVSGVWCQAQISILDCGVKIFPDLSEYMGIISNRVSPLDWQGVIDNPNKQGMK